MIPCVSMRLSSDEGDFIELRREDKSDRDVCVAVSVARSGFEARASVWILADVWHAFAQALSALEKRRQGEARVEGISPGELLLVVKSLDRAGHLGVEGLVGLRRHDRDVSLRFSVFPVDPSQLAGFASEARDMAATVTASER